MDQTIHRTPLATLVDELRRSERFVAYAGAFPARARVSDPALPLFLAALFEELQRPLLVLLPEDAQARDAAEGVAWFVGGGQVALLPGRGVGETSGLEP